MKTILIVIADWDHRHLIHFVVFREGYETFQASDITQGFELAKQHQPDLIFTRWDTPEINGQELGSWFLS